MKQQIADPVFGRQVFSAAKIRQLLLTMIRNKAKLGAFILSLSKYERDGFSLSTPSTMLRTGFDKLRANGHFSLYAYHRLLMYGSHEDLEEAKTGVAATSQPVFQGNYPFREVL
jgi:hypothetical protein